MKRGPRPTRRLGKKNALHTIFMKFRSKRKICEKKNATTVKGDEKGGILKGSLMSVQPRKENYRRG